MKLHQLIPLFIFNSKGLITDMCSKQKYWYKLELQTLETRRLLGSTKKEQTKQKAMEIERTEEVEVVLL